MPLARLPQIPPAGALVVRIGVGRLSALNEVGGIKNGPKMRAVAALQQIDTAGDGITIDVLLVLMQQHYTCRPRPCRHFTQPSEHLVAILSWIGGTTVSS